MREEQILQSASIRLLEDLELIINQQGTKISSRTKDKEGCYLLPAKNLTLAQRQKGKKIDDAKRLSYAQTSLLATYNMAKVLYDFMDGMGIATAHTAYNKGKSAGKIIDPDFKTFTVQVVDPLSEKIAKALQQFYLDILGPEITASTTPITVKIGDLALQQLNDTWVMQQRNTTGKPTGLRISDFPELDKTLNEWAKETHIFNKKDLLQKIRKIIRTKQVFSFVYRIIDKTFGISKTGMVNIQWFYDNQSSYLDLYDRHQERTETILTAKAQARSMAKEAEIDKSIAEKLIKNNQELEKIKKELIAGQKEEARQLRPVINDTIRHYSKLVHAANNIKNINNTESRFEKALDIRNQAIELKTKLEKSIAQYRIKQLIMINDHWTSIICTYNKKTKSCEFENIAITLETELDDIISGYLTNLNFDEVFNITDIYINKYLPAKLTNTLDQNIKQKLDALEHTDSYQDLEALLKQLEQDKAALKHTIPFQEIASQIPKEFNTDSIRRKLTEIIDKYLPQVKQQLEALLAKVPEGKTRKKTELRLEFVAKKTELQDLYDVLDELQQRYDIDIHPAASFVETKQLLPSSANLIKKSDDQINKVTEKDIAINKITTEKQKIQTILNQYYGLNTSNLYDKITSWSSSESSYSHQLEALSQQKTTLKLELRGIKKDFAPLVVQIRQKISQCQDELNHLHQAIKKLDFDNPALNQFGLFSLNKSAPRSSIMISEHRKNTLSR